MIDQFKFAAQAVLFKLLNVIKKQLKRILYDRKLNHLIRMLMSPFFCIMPDVIKNRIPVIGTFHCNLPQIKKTILMHANGNDQIATILYWKGINAFEGNAIKLFIDLLKYSEVVFDIGANTGIYSLIAAVADPKIKVYAFEPVPKIFEYLKRNVRINNLENLQTICGAVANYDGDIKLYVPHGDIPTSASTIEGFRESKEVISARSIMIDSFVDDNKINKVDLIKIDTEATEHLVLEGAINTIKRDNPLIICEVLKGLTERKLHFVLDKFGYKYFWIYDQGLIEKKRIEGDKTYINMNYLFIPESKRQFIGILMKSPVCQKSDC